eukprot:TRINITY_DN4491_c0_g1_i1.p1 TRINITY_DN4491_c0_g1~~TRINITY_DN4491_c0_g1_i1.p1  ORF type:complete len:911 (-),score=170.70 TRINITY_DN4491_c0_g1_i1:456-3188(-)
MGDADSEPERPHSDSARPRGYSEGPIAEAKGRRRAAALQALRSIVQPLPLSRTTGAARSRLSARLGFSTRRFGEAGEASMSDCGSSVGTATDDRRDSELLNYASAPLYQAYSRDDSGSNSPPSARGNGAAAANATAANVTATAAEAGHLRHRPRRSSITVAELRRPSAELLAAAATSPEPQHMQAHTVSEPAAARRTGSIHRQGSFSGMFTAAFGGSSQWKVSPASSPISPPPSPPHLTAARTDLARDADAVLKYGQALRLWARSPYLGATTPRGSVSDATDPAAGRGGYVGTYSKATRVRAVLGRDQLLVVGPVGHIAGEYTELTLLVIDPTGKRGEGQTVRYGDIVCLLDMRGYALNSRTGGRTGYVDIKPRHMKGEMHISFRPGAEYDLDRNSASHRDLLQETSPQPSQLQLLHMGTSAFSGLGSPRSSQHNPSAQGSFESEAVRYGDSNVVAMVEDSSTRMAPNLKLRQHACQPLTIFKKDSSSVAGGYLCCDGKGHTLRFQIHRSKAFIRCVTIYQLEGGSGSKTPYVRQQLHHNVAWDTPITFELPPVQVASAFKQLSQPAVTVTFTNRGCTHISAATLLQVKGVTLLPVEGGSEQGCLRVYIDARPAAAPLPVVETLKESTARLVLWPFTVCGIAVVASNMVASVFPHFLSTRPRVAALVTVLVTAAMLVAWKLMLGGGFGQRRRGSLKATGMLVTLVFQGWEDLVAGDSAADGPNSTRSTEGPGSFNSATESNGDGNIYGPNTLGLGGDFIPEVVPGLPPMPRRFLVSRTVQNYFTLKVAPRCFMSTVKGFFKRDAQSRIASTLKSLLPNTSCLLLKGVLGHNRQLRAADGAQVANSAMTILQPPLVHPSMLPLGLVQVVHARLMFSSTTVLPLLIFRCVQPPGAPQSSNFACSFNTAVEVG